MPIKKIEAGRVITETINTFIGIEGTIFYDEHTAEMRLSDGVTPGGIPIQVGGATAITYIGSLPPLNPTSGVLWYNTDNSNLYVYYNSNWVLATVQSTQLEVSNISADNTLTNVVTSVTALRFDSDSGFDVVDLGSGEVKIAMNSTFKTWQVDGQEDLIAFGLDTIRFIAGSGINITTDPHSGVKSITFSSTSTQYTLPIATTSTIGGVKIGTGLTVTTDGLLSLSAGYQINKVTDIPDVNSTTLENGSLLVYNQGASRWDTRKDLVTEVIDGGEF
jgi:hypothetical protein